MKIKLGDIFEIGSGGTPSKTHPEYYGGDIPWVKTGDLKSEYLYEVEDYITEAGLKNSSAKMYDADTVLIAMYGATIGATSILKFKACTNQACAAFKKNEQVIPEYLYYFLRSKQNKFVKDGVGGAQPNISAGYLKKVEMELPELNVQRQIVDVLDKVAGILNKRAEELSALDELIKARFVELFGDPITNSKNLPMEKMDERYFLKAGITTSADGIHDYIEGEYEIPCYGGNGVRGYVEEKSYEGEYPIIGRQGALCGNVQYASGKFHATEHAVLVSVLKGDNTVWTYYMLKLMDLYRYHTGAAQPGLAVKTLNIVDVIVADIKLQNQFADFVKQVDKSKAVVQDALDKDMSLFNSLMQKYFG